MLLRWYFRLFVWARFLWHVPRMDIAYALMYPDRTGHIGFQSRTGYAFAPLLLAQRVLLAGTIANRIFFDGAALPEFKLLVFTFVAAVLAAVLAPLLVFICRFRVRNVRGCASTVTFRNATSTSSRRSGCAA